MAKIGLDIGHGNNTFPPSKGVYKNGKGYAEHSFNAKLGMAIKKLLEQNGHTVILGQQPNKADVPLRTRTNLYNSKGVDLVISVHANYNASASVNGRCAFYWGTSSKSKSLVQAIIKEIKTKGYSTHGSGLHAGKRGSWTNLHINRETNMPAVLVEHGFMSGNKDFELIFGGKQDQYIKDMAEADVKGIQKWLGEEYKNVQTAGKPSKPSVSSGGSVVDYMNKKGMDSSFGNRKKLAKQYGVKNYKGTASQNISLLNKLKGGKPKSKKSISTMANEILAGKHSTGHANRRRSLNISQPEYNKVRAEVNRLSGVKPSPKPKQSIEQMANRILTGKGVPNGHEARRKWLGIDNVTYQKVRSRVNQKLR